MTLVATALLILCIAGSGFMLAAGELQGTGPTWADQACSALPAWCEHPYWGPLVSMAMATICMLAQAIEHPER